MATAVADTVSLEMISVNERLFRAVIDSVNDALVMCQLEAKCVGASSIPSAGTGNITSMIGVHGTASGFVTINAAERFAIRAVGGLLQEESEKITAQVIDGFGEIGNIITGGIKARLAGSEWSFSKITVPSVIIGDAYEISYSKGLQYLCVTYEHNDPEAIRLEDRLLRISMSLLRV